MDVKMTIILVKMIFILPAPIIGVHSRSLEFWFIYVTRSLICHFITRSVITNIRHEVLIDLHDDGDDGSVRSEEDDHTATIREIADNHAL